MRFEPIEIMPSHVSNSKPGIAFKRAIDVGLLTNWKVGFRNGCISSVFDAALGGRDELSARVSRSSLLDAAGETRRRRCCGEVSSGEAGSGDDGDLGSSGLSTVVILMLIAATLVVPAVIFTAAAWTSAETRPSVSGPSPILANGEVDGAAVLANLRKVGVRPAEETALIMPRRGMS